MYMEASMTTDGDDGGSGAVEVSITRGLEIPRITTTQRVDGQHVMSVQQDEEAAYTEYELKSIIIGNSDLDSKSTNLTERDGGLVAIPVGNEPRITTEFYWDPKDVAYLLRPYPALIGLVAGKFIWEKQTLLFTANPFMIASVVAYAMALINLVILSFIYDLAENSPYRHFSPGHYKIPKHAFYIFCLLAYSLLVPMLFIPH